MSLTRLSLVFLACLPAAALAFAPVPVYRESMGATVRTDEQKLQGTWRLEYAAIGGWEGDALACDETAIFAGGRLLVRARCGTLKWSFVLDPTASPKRVALRDEWSAEIFEKSSPLCGIYRLEGDRLTLCRALDSDESRPTEFEAAPGVSLEVYRRVRRGDRPPTLSELLARDLSSRAAREELAAALDEAGRDKEADLCRAGLEKPIRVVNDRVVDD